MLLSFCGSYGVLLPITVINIDLILTLIVILTLNLWLINGPICEFRRLSWSSFINISWANMPWTWLFVFYIPIVYFDCQIILIFPSLFCFTVSLWWNKRISRFLVLDALWLIWGLKLNIERLQKTKHFIAEISTRSD